ncbi:zinc-binding dehydrogenase, partial [Salmonella enterica subsp. enterica serovar 1,4,[5],12:i:-]
YGVGNIIAVDGVPARLEMARTMGASVAVRTGEGGEVAERVRQATRGRGVDFAFQCTGVPAAAAALWKFVRRGGGLCEVGFFMDNGT